MNTRWMEQAACVPIGVNEWFGPSGESGINAGKRTRRNCDVCTACPVRLECARYALQTRTSSGVYAGFDLDEPFSGRALRAFVAQHNVVVDIGKRRHIAPLSNHPEAVAARNRRARLEQQRRNAAAEASA
jgi:WhiB family transcriptional regulator, redox-sensing transcriptional regulator